jgi:hypothetical protein
MDNVKVDILFSAPSILEDLSQSPEVVEKLSQLHAVHYAGGTFTPSFAL